MQSLSTYSNSASSYLNWQAFMAILPILQYPDERLHQVAKKVERMTDATRQLIQDMSDTMYSAPGVGLAATQVNVHQQIIVVDVSEAKDKLIVLINPIIIKNSGESEFEEGCLSLPGIYEKVQRADQITVKADNVNGEEFILDATGLLSVCIQHEMDHLQGKVFIEYLSQLKQSRIRKRLKKIRREIL
jgi:peptide deformylase